MNKIKKNALIKKNINSSYNNQIEEIKNKNNVKYNFINIPKYLIFIIILIFFILCIGIYYLFIKIKKKFTENGIEEVINEAMLPLSDEEYIVKKYRKSDVDYSHIRYNLDKLYDERKKFQINYSYLPYTKIDKSLSYDENAQKLYESTGMLNVTKLDYYYNNTYVDTSNFNHIHLSECFDLNYIELTSVSMSSILNASSPYTYIHFHILVYNFTFQDMKKLIQLRRINKNVEFVFYNSKQAYYDYGEKAVLYRQGLGDFSKALAPEIVNNTNKLLILDSGDMIAQKDISEIYFYDIGDNYFGWVLDPFAGNEYYLFYRNIIYPNTGVCLVNIRLFRQDNLYRSCYFIFLSYYNILKLPFQDIASAIPIHRVKLMPLKYNCINFFEYNEEFKNKANDSERIRDWVKFQQYSSFHYTYEEILDAAYDPVLIHYFFGKVQEGIGIGCNVFTKQWVNYAKISGLYKDIKSKFPLPFYACKDN